MNNILMIKLSKCSLTFACRTCGKLKITSNCMQFKGIGTTDLIVVYYEISGNR